MENELMKIIKQQNKDLKMSRPLKYIGKVLIYILFLLFTTYLIYIFYYIDLIKMYLNVMNENA